MNLLRSRRDKDSDLQRGRASAVAKSENGPEKWSNQMRKMISFTFGVLIGTIVATA